MSFPDTPDAQGSKASEEQQEHQAVQPERSLTDISEDGAAANPPEPSLAFTDSLQSPLLLSPNGAQAHESPTTAGTSTPPPALHKRQSYSRLPRRVSQLGTSPSAAPTAAAVIERSASPVEGSKTNGSAPAADDELTRLQIENANLRKRLDRAESYATNLESSFRDLTNSPLRPAFASSLHPPADIVEGSSSDAQTQALPHSKPMFDLKQKISGGNLRAAFRLQQQAQVQATSAETNGDMETNRGAEADEGESDDKLRTPQQSLVNGSSSTTGKGGRYAGLGRGTGEDEGRAFPTRESPAKGELSRIPSSHVHSSVALHAASQPVSTSTGSETRPASPSTSGASPRPSPGPRRASSSSSKVIDEIKSENDALKTLTEKMRRDLTESRKQVASLHTANEDLKGTRERMRAEVDSLNNVISRKERLLQEVLERARKAEGEVQVHAKERKAIETANKQTVNELKNRLGEAEVLSSRSERETTALRDSLKSLKEQWKREVRALRSEIKASAEELRKEKTESSRKHAELVKLVQTQVGNRKELQALEESSQRINQQLIEHLQPQIDEMKKTIETEIADKESSTTIASELQAELARLKRLMQSSSADE